jgi:hypothetical protein
MITLEGCDTTTGEVTMLPLAWGSKKQTVTATSSGESESIALAMAYREALTLASLLEESSRETPLEIIAHCDNSAVVTSVHHGHSKGMGHLKKHIGLSYAFLRECEITLRKIATDVNIADMLTKPMYLRQKLNSLLKKVVDTHGKNESTAVGLARLIRARIKSRKP